MLRLGRDVVRARSKARMDQITCLVSQSESIYFAYPGPCRGEGVKPPDGYTDRQPRLEDSLIDISRIQTYPSGRQGLRLEITWVYHGFETTQAKFMFWLQFSVGKADYFISQRVQLC